MGGTSEDAGAVERAAKFAALAGATADLRLAGAALDEAIEDVNAIAAVAKVLLHMGLAAGKAALATAGIPPATVELAERLATRAIEKQRGKIAGASA